MPKKESDSVVYPLDPLLPFEVFHEGSWHATDCIFIQDGNMSVQIKHPTPTMLVNIHTDFLRMRSRKATSLDCCDFLKPGIDVCVLLPRSVSSSPNQASQIQHFVWLDARIIKIKRSHADRCNCLFAVMPYKLDGLTHMQKLVCDFERTTLVKIDQVSILQKLDYNIPDENGNVIPCSTKNGTSVYEPKLLSFTNTFSPAIATLLVFSTLCGAIEVKVVQDRVVYHVLQTDVNKDASTMNMKVVNFINCDGVIKPKVESLSIEHTCTEEQQASTGGFEDKIVVPKAENVYEEMNIRRSKREKIQPIFYTGYTSPSPNFGCAPSAKGIHSSKPQPENKSCSEDVAFEKKPAVRSSYVKVVQKDGSCMPHGKPNMKRKEHFCTEECTDFTEKLMKDLEMPKGMGPHQLHEKHGAKSKYFGTKECHDLIDELIKDQAKRRKRGWPYQLHDRHGAKRRQFCTKECDEFIQELMADIRCCMSKKVKPGLQWAEEACASAQGYYPLEEDFVWPPTDSDDEIEKPKEKDEYEELWEDMDYCLNALALDEEKKNFDSGDEMASGKDKEESCVHDCVLNEQLGYICIRCNVVITEIRDILPPVMKERRYQIPKDSAHTEPKLYPFEIDPSFSKTPPKTNQSKPSNNIWTPILCIEPKLHPHQRKAFEFIWKNLVGTLEPEKISITNGNTGGCVLSHSPGAGKTLTVISFLISYMAVFPDSHPLVLTPKSAIHTWESEFKKWDIEVPVHIIHQDKAYRRKNLNGAMKGPLDSHHLPSQKTLKIMDSVTKVKLWHENPGVLLMTYPSFLSLMKGGRNNEYYEFMANVLQTSPGLLVLDEGHNPRSTKSKLRRLLMKVNTESRILLSGTVFQNNFAEYFNTLCLARPRFVRDVINELEPKTRPTESKRGRKTKDEEKRAQKLFVEKIGQKIESQSRWDQRHGFDLLREITSGFINAFDGKKLLNLPGIETYTISLKCTEPQEKILQKLQNSQKIGPRYPLETEFLVSVGAIHPCLVSTSKAAKAFFTEKELKEIGKKRQFSRGSKTSFVIDVIMKSLMRKERVLVFCHNIEPLKLLIKLIESTFDWREGKEILFLYGDQDLSARYDVIDRFNDDKKGKGKVLLASTNACAEGISLTAASRIVLLDSEWNPSKTKQAVARAFRPGQEKKVFVYLLLAAGSWEESKYELNKKKARMSKMVLSGTCIEDSGVEVVNNADITDELLREIVEEDNNINKTVRMVVKH